MRFGSLSCAKGVMCTFVVQSQLYLKSQHFKWKLKKLRKNGWHGAWEAALPAAPLSHLSARTDGYLQSHQVLWTAGENCLQSSNTFPDNIPVDQTSPSSTLSFLHNSLLLPLLYLIFILYCAFLSCVPLSNASLFCASLSSSPLPEFLSP